MIEVTTAAPPTDVDAVAAECETLEEWREELDSLPDEGAVHLDVRRAGSGWAVPDAVRAVGERFGGGAATVIVHVASARQAEAARTALQNEPPPGASRYRVGALTVELRSCDIVSVRADALVNASNTQLKLGSGVSGALARACGPGLQQEMFARAPIGDLDLVETASHKLQTVRRLLHVPTASGDEQVIVRAYANVLSRCAERGFVSVGLPALGAGSGRLPLVRCAELLARAALDAPSGLRDDFTVIVALHQGRGRQAFEDVFARLGERL